MAIFKKEQIDFDLEDDGINRDQDPSSDQKDQMNEMELDLPPVPTPQNIHKINTQEMTPISLAQEISDNVSEPAVNEKPSFSSFSELSGLSGMSAINSAQTKQPQDLNPAAQNGSSSNMYPYPDPNFSQQASPLSESNMSASAQDLSSLAEELRESFGLNDDKRRQRRRMIILISVMAVLLAVLLILPETNKITIDSVPISSSVDQVDTNTTSSSLVTEDHSLENKDLGADNQKDSSPLLSKLSDVVDMVKGGLQIIGSKDGGDFSAYPPGTIITSKKTTKTTSTTTTPLQNNGSTDQNPIPSGAQVVGGSSDNQETGLSKLQQLKQMVVDALDGLEQLRQQPNRQWTPDDEMQLKEHQAQLQEVDTVTPKIQELDQKITELQAQQNSLSDEDKASLSQQIAQIREDQEQLLNSVREAKPARVPGDYSNEEIASDQEEQPYKSGKKRIYGTPEVARTPYVKDLPQEQMQASGQIPDNPYWFLPNKNFEFTPSGLILDPETETEFREKLSSPFNYQRYQAILDLKRLRFKGSDPLLESGLSEDKLWLRMNAVMALSDIGATVTIDDVEKALSKDRSDLISGFFKRYASREYVTGGELLVMRFAIRVCDKYSRFNILRALARWDSNLADLYFTAATYDPDPKIARYATAYLKKNPVDQETHNFYIEVITGTTDVDFTYDSQTNAEISSLEVN